MLWPWVVLRGCAKINLPCLSAATEARNAERLRQLGVRAPKVLGWARWRIQPTTRGFGVRRCSSITLASVPGLPSDVWLRKNHADPLVLGPWLAAVAQLVARMHSRRIAHRDLYLCHLYWDESASALSLIDVARARPRRWRWRRWQVKDLAALWASARPWLSEQSALRFLVLYLRACGGERPRGSSYAALSRAIIRKATHIEGRRDRGR